jgi:hypothetical protein
MQIRPSARSARVEQQKVLALRKDEEQESLFRRVHKDFIASLTERK